MIRMGIGVIDGFVRDYGVFERTPKYNITSEEKQFKNRGRQYIPIDWLILIEILYILILGFGVMKTIFLGGFYLFNGFYFLFLLLSTVNLVISEILHSFSTRSISV